MKKELKSNILSADKSADCRPTFDGVNVIAVLLKTIDSTIACKMHMRTEANMSLDPKSIRRTAIATRNALIEMAKIKPKLQK